MPSKTDTTKALTCFICGTQAPIIASAMQHKRFALLGWVCLRCIHPHTKG